MRNCEMKDLFILLNVACLCHIISTQSDGDVRLPPSLIRSPNSKNIVYAMRERITLECSATGTPAVRYEWKKNGFELNTNLPNIRKGSDGTVIIDEATRKDEGYYQCFARNRYGATLSNITEIRMAFIDRLILIFSWTSVVEGMPFYIRGDPQNCFPKPSYSWSIGTELLSSQQIPVLPSKRIQVADNGDLHFAHVVPEDAFSGGLYNCIKSNKFQQVQRNGCNILLKVTRNPRGNISEFAPILAFSSEVLTVALLGESVTLRCFFYGYPQPNISWIGPRNALPTGRFSVINFETQLQIDNITESDEGEYNCTASNTKGNNTRTLQIRVEAAPKFKYTKDGPYNVNKTEGESVTFNCNAFAKPQAKIVWLQNGQPIDTDHPPKRFVFSNDNKSLTIRNVCRDCVDRENQTDLMVIQCHASNVHGYAFASGYLNVLMKTNVTIRGSKHVSVDFLKEQTIIFQCYVTSDPSTPPTVRWYKTEPFGDLVRDEPPYVDVENAFLVIMIDPNCSADCAKYLGEYRCVGENRYSQENRTITISYNYRPEAVTQNKETWALWKIILVAGAIAFVLFLIGIFLGFLSKRRSGNVSRRMKKRKVPNPPNMYEHEVHDSDGIPLEEVRNYERSMTREWSMYEHVGYASIEQVLEEMARNRSESIDATQQEAVNQDGPMTDEDAIYDDTGYPIPLEEVTNRGNTYQQQINGYRSKQSEYETFPNSNEQSEATNTYADLSRKEVTSYMELGPKEVNPYLELCSNEEDLYLNTDQNEINTYVDMDKKK